MVGDGTAACPRNDILGAVNLRGNHSVEFDTNRVSGSVSITDTVGTPLAAVVAGNQITGNLPCTGNISPPTTEGRPNAILGTNSGQCAPIQ